MNPFRRAPRAALGLAAATLLALAGCTSMNTGGTGAAGATTGARLATDDRVYAMQAAGGGMYEVEAGRLAATRAASPEVRAFGQMLVDHHTASNAELMSLLQARGLPPPPALPTAMAAKIARLAPLSGAAFDQEFIRNAGIADHQTQIELFMRASRDVADPALRAWFTKTLPSLQAHLQAAQGIAGRIAG
jgi:putative membrane protein